MNDTDGLQPIDQGLLIRHLTGEATPSERRAVERWLAAAPEHLREYAELQWMWTQAGALPTPQRMADMWRAIVSEMHAENATVVDASPIGTVATSDAVVTAALSPRSTLRLEKPAAHRTTVAPRTRSWRTAALVAAEIAAVVILTVVLGPRLVHRGADADVESTREIVTTKGQQARVQLGDGSRVDVAPESVVRIRFIRGGERTVYLEGEAMFSVAHDAKRPFIVHSAHGVTEDLGTEFGVRAYPGDSVVQVVVVAGSVAFGAAQENETSRTVLRRGQIARLNLRNQMMVETGITADAALAWTRNRVVFRQARVRDVAAYLERWYNVSIAVPDSLVQRQRVTLNIPAGSVSEVLNAVTAPLELHVRSTGDGYAIVAR